LPAHSLIQMLPSKITGCASVHITSDVLHYVQKQTEDVII